MGKTYALSDLHGRYDLWKQISEYCDANDTIYFLGDAVDRGPECFKLFSELQKDSRVIYLKGNHEDFLADALMDYIKGDTQTLVEWVNDGGLTTWEDIHLFSEDTFYYIIRRINQMPIKQTYTREDGKVVFLSHAGFSPWSYLADSENHLLNDRKHMDFGWLKGYENVYIVHGHTPAGLCGDPDVMLPQTSQPQIYVYADGHKIDIDTGAVWTGVAALLDLDTFEVKYFEAKEE